MKTISNDFKNFLASTTKQALLACAIASGCLAHAAPIGESPLPVKPLFYCEGLDGTVNKFESVIVRPADKNFIEVEVQNQFRYSRVVPDQRGNLFTGTLTLSPKEIAFLPPGAEYSLSIEIQEDGPMPNGHIVHKIGSKVQDQKLSCWAIP